MKVVNNVNFNMRKLVLLLLFLVPFLANSQDTTYVFNRKTFYPDIRSLYYERQDVSMSGKMYMRDTLRYLELDGGAMFVLGKQISSMHPSETATYYSFKAIRPGITGEFTIGLFY